MGNFRRTVWAAVIFMALLAPFAIVLVMRLSTPTPPGVVVAAQQAGAASQDSPAFPAMTITPPPAVTQPATQAAYLLAGGDAKTLWVIHPITSGDSDKKVPTFELLARASDSGTWSQAAGEHGTYFSGFPNGLAVVASAGGKARAEAYVFTDRFITEFTLSDHALLNHPLPGDQTLLSETGGVGEMLAVTRGPEHPVPAATATAPADIAAGVPPPGSIDIPTVENVSDSQPATTRATTAASQPQVPIGTNAWWYHNDDWVALPSLADAASKTPNAPMSGSAITLAIKSGRLIALWVNPGAPGLLIASSLDYAKRDARWSPWVVTNLNVALPADSRLLSITLDDSVYVFWPVVTSNALVLHGGWLNAKAGAAEDLTLPAKNLFAPMNIGQSVKGQTASDVAIGPAENSIAVLVSGAQGALTCQLFTNRGRAIGPATAVESKLPAHDMQIVQNVAMLLLALMLALSFWQWRHRPTRVQLPQGMSTASLPLRGFAFLIDMGISFIVVTGFVGIGDLGSMATAWMESFSNPDGLLSAPALLYMLGFYLLHVTVGELFFRRSIGKALLGLEVLMIDGKAPTVAAVLLRNLVRIPELLPGILVIYLLISDTHQRLGDVLARTLVVSGKAPETPADPDVAGKKDAVEPVKKDRLK